LMQQKKTGARGPEPERLSLPGNWMANVGKALKKKRPATGWPRPAPNRKKA